MPGGRKHCISCGKKTVQWPRGNPQACSMRCLALRVLAEYSRTHGWQCDMPGGDGFHCPDCGLHGDDQHCEFLEPELGGN